ncbi:MAG: semialdehyde dehydrogenase [Gammaproteobacteria bacterium]|jgi:aspartate-semialdehyde dehydrogenase|nr:semialdehyde dehydrogenase [Gammaproteobacteria bacterium]
MNKRIDIAVVGATGAVGRTMLAILAERKFPVGKIYVLASEHSAGKTISFANQNLLVTPLAHFDFRQVQIALFSAGGSVSADYAPIAAQAGCIVIDNSSHFRYQKTIPLVVSEVNPEQLVHYKNHNLIANPNCSTMQMLVALKPIYDAVGIERINVATYQSVSGAGQLAVNELYDQTTKVLAGQSIEAELLHQPIAFNVIPHIAAFLDNGYTQEEMKMIWETQKILADNNLKVNPTAVRVPVVCGHSEALHIETREKITAKQARALLTEAPGVKLMDEPSAAIYPTPAQHASGTDWVYVGRVREDLSHPRGLNLWVVSDNLRKGAALNAVQIAELLVKDYL